MRQKDYKATMMRKDLRKEDKERGAAQRVYICSQYGSQGNKQNNLELAKLFCMNVLEGGHVPICPHLFLCQVLNDDVNSQRECGLNAGLRMLEDADMLMVCSRLSEGMKAEIEKAWEMEIPVEIMDMRAIYGEDQAAAVEKEIREQLEALYGKKHHTEAYR